MSPSPVDAQRPSPAPRPAAPPVGGVGALGARGGVPLGVPLPFLLTGAGAAALFGLLLPLVAAEALLTPLFPHVLALVHLATLGWLTMTIMGASLQLTPVILVSRLRATRFIRWQFPVYATGVVLLVCGFAFMRPWLLAVGGAIVVIAVAHYAVVLGTTLARATTRPLTARYLAAAVVYLCIVVSLGLTAALNLQLHFLDDVFMRLLLAHIALGIIGWLTTMLIGVSYTLVRMFALVHGHSDRLGQAIFALLNGGVIGLALGFALAWQPLVLLAGAVLTVAVWLFAYDYVRMLRARRRKLLDVTQRHGIAAVAYMALTLPLALVAMLAGQTRSPQLVALGLAALVGWLGQSIVGYLYKIVPFLIWQTRYAPLVGRAKVPLMRDLLRAGWAEASFWLLNLGLLAATLSAAFGWLVPLQLGAAAMALGLLLAAANIVHGVLPGRHALPEPGPAQTGKE